MTSTRPHPLGGARFTARPVGLAVLLAAVAWLLSIADTLIHTRDSWTSVVPWGLTLSALCVLILMFTAWMGRSMVYGHRVGVAE